MKLYRVSHENGVRWCRELDGKTELLSADFTLGTALGKSKPVEWVRGLKGTSFALPKNKILAPIEDQDLWGCGVTYLDSRRARIQESADAPSLYDRVYSAARPQIFPKGRGREAFGQGEALQLRSDSSWVVPEPELVLVIAANGQIVGATVGDDLTCRDIEGENPLYQPQAKIWRGSAVLGPCIEMAENGDWKNRKIELVISRQGTTVFKGESSSSQIARPFPDLVNTLFKYRRFNDGVFLFTGTGIVPPDAFHLLPGDQIQIMIQGIGKLENPTVFCEAALSSDKAA